MERSSVYKAQCRTFEVAQMLANDHRMVTTELDAHLKPPFCLRVLREYRTEEMQKFRDLVAATTILLK